MKLVTLYIKSQKYLNLIMTLKRTTFDLLAIRQLRDEFVEGDDKAYSILYNLFAKDLYAFGLSLKASTELVEDAIHDVFVEIYAHRQNLEKVDNLKYYFIAAFRNRLFYLIKKESKTTGITETNFQGLNERDFQEEWIEREIEDERQILLKRLFRELNEHQREALYHRFVEGLSCDEIADLMNINYQSAKNLILRAIKKLKSVAAFAIILLLLLRLG
ncbi:MAG: sigma-70 family RNA polymerase sigma factor [Bacteroidota bacterium]|nr:sigma-70 family RNA polymerase sigma factor [Bacteroidota bacterium]